MRKVIVYALVFMFVFTIVGVPVQAKKIGEINENVFTDNDHGFSIHVPGGWSSTIGSKSKVPLRLTLTQNSYPVPRAFQGGNEDYAQIPTVMVFADTTSLTVDKFVEGLQDSEFKSKQKDYFMKKLKLISKPHDVQKSQEISFADNKAIIQSVRQAYSIEVSNRGSSRADVVNDYKSGSIFFTVRDGKVYIIHLISEYQQSANYAELFNTLVSSLSFGESAEGEPEKK